MADAIAKVRAKNGLNCQTCVRDLETALPGGRPRPHAGTNFYHESYSYQGKVIDPTAAQYVKPAKAGVWTEAELQQAGLKEAVETGVFTPEQHVKFLEGLQRRWPDIAVE